MKKAAIALSFAIFLSNTLYSQQSPVLGLTAHVSSAADDLGVSVGLSSLPDSTAPGAAAIERRTFQLINAQRQERGLEPLVWNDDLARAARLHSRNMAEYKFFSHKGLDGSMVDDRADQFGIRDWRAIGENIAYNRGYPHPDEFAVESWMRSASHRKNLLNNSWVESGIGLAISPDGAYFFTQIFLLRK